MATNPPLTPQPSDRRPILLLLSSHWLSMLGVTLITLAGCSWLIVLPLHMRGRADNPYIGLLAFLVLPAIFFVGLALTPIGIFLAKHRVKAGLEALPDRRTAWRRLAIFFVAGTCLNVIIGSQITYRAVEYMETRQFCGQSCHVMLPEFTAFGRTPAHQSIDCVSCHAGPGAMAYVKAKSAGTRQLMDVVFNTFPRPIPSAMESDRLAPASDTCEGCHSRDRIIGSRLRMITQFKDDEANTPTYTVLMMPVGGGRLGGIHGAHLGPGVHIRYASDGKKRDQIPWVEYQDSETTEKRSYLANGAKPDAATSLPVFEMQCVDCHNRAAHSFEPADRAIDRALALGEISRALPFVRKTGIELLKVAYQNSDDAAQKISSGLAAFYQKTNPDVAAKHAQEVTDAGKALAAIYNSNVFPDLKVTWGTYPNHLGHTDSLGCFRCHDDNHTLTQGSSPRASGAKTITQDCNTCHESLATEEASPEILKTLGLANGLAALHQPPAGTLPKR